ncbi:MAG: hypothetical protein RR332_02055 [Clostridiales bacterium]
MTRYQQQYDPLYKHARVLLYDYQANRRELASLRAEAIDRKSAADVQPGTRHSSKGDPTAARVMALSDGRIAELERAVKAVDTVFSNLTERERRFIELVYLQSCFSVSGAARQLYISNSTAWRINEKVLIAIIGLMHWR